MQNTYQVPSKANTSSERHAFWNKVIIDQNNSGMSMKKFCRLHQLKYSTYKGYRYRIYGTNKLLRKSKQNNNTAKFIPLQIGSDNMTETHSKNKTADNKIEVKIELNNAYKIILPLAVSETNLLWLIKMVAKL